MNKKVLYIDMDGVLVDFNKAITKFLNTHPHLKDKFKDCPDPVSYTHLTLPTIYSV